MHVGVTDHGLRPSEKTHIVGGAKHDWPMGFDGSATGVSVLVPSSSRRSADMLMVSTARKSAVAALTPTVGTEIARDGGRQQLPWPVTVVVADANVLAQACVRAAQKGSTPNVFTILGTGRADILIGSHVPGEMGKAIAKITVRKSVLTKAALDIWTEVVAPQITVIDLPIGEYLRPEVQVVAQGVPGVPADPTDLPTIALAAFVPSAAIWTRDRIFTETGLAAHNASDTLGNLTTICVAESTTADTAGVAAFSVRAGAVIVDAIQRAAVRRPAGSIVLVGVVLFLLVLDANSRGKAATVGKSLVRGAGLILGELLQAAAEIEVDRKSAFDSLVRYESPAWRRRTPVEVCAGILTRSAGPMTATELLTVLRQTGGCEVPATVSALKQQLHEHPAFTRHGSRWRLGVRASTYVNTR